MTYQAHISDTTIRIGKYTDYITDENGKVISPLFDHCTPMFQWMHENGYQFDGYLSLKVIKVAPANAAA